MNIISKNTKPSNSNQSNILIEDEYITILKRLDEKIFLTEIKKENTTIKMKDEFLIYITITCEDVPFLLSNISEMEIYEEEKLLNVYNVVYSSIGLKRKRIIEDNFVSNKKKKILVFGRSCLS
jgi:stage III sporulation protein SpoIIIAA